MKLKKIVAVMLVGTMLSGITACGQSGGGEKTSSEEKETSKETKQEVTQAGPVDWKEPYGETVTLHVVRAATTNEFPEGDDLTNNIWTRDYKEKFNVEVITDWISDDYDTKLNLAISGGELPDVFTVDNVQLNQLIDAGMIADLTEIYETYGSNSLKSIYESDNETFATAQRDGKIYAMPSMYFGFQPPILWLRQDWLKETNKDFPKTVDELEEILLEMKEISGEYSYSVDQTLDSLYGLAPAWNAYPKMWLEGKDGKLVYGATTSEMKEALQEWADWYKKGILKEDFATLTSETMKEETVSGKTGAETCGSWWGWTYGSDMVKNLGEEAYFMPCEIPTVSGEKANYPMPIQNSRYIVVNKNCKNPEAVIKLIDYFVWVQNDAVPDGEMTIEEFMDYTSFSMVHNTEEFAVDNPQDDYNRYKMVTEARKTGDKSVLTSGVAYDVYEGAKLWTDEKNPDGIGYALQFGMDGCAMEVLNGVMEEERIVRDKLWGVSPQPLLDYGTTLNDILLEGFTKIIMGVEDISYFDTLVKSWYTAGGQMVTDAMNEMYK